MDTVAEHTAAGDRQRSLVLVVEDRADLRLLCRVNLEFAGFRVVEAADAAGALVAAGHEPPRALVLDLGLPDMDGWDLLDRLRTERQVVAPSVVVVTGRPIGPERRRARREGVAALLAKPYLPSALVESVASAAVATG
ncbi:MAG: response regulator [Acidimicrobiia bacterium]|nr:response regulator [Acidimicrobiia bacterium]